MDFIGYFEPKQLEWIYKIVIQQIKFVIEDFKDSERMKLRINYWKYRSYI